MGVALHQVDGKGLRVRIRLELSVLKRVWLIKLRWGRSVTLAGEGGDGDREGGGGREMVSYRGV